jgi:hypothetical protein
MNHLSITACAIDTQLTSRASIIIQAPSNCPNLNRRLSSSRPTQSWDICSMVKYDETEAYLLTFPSTPFSDIE